LIKRFDKDNGGKPNDDKTTAAGAGLGPKNEDPNKAEKKRNSCLRAGLVGKERVSVRFFPRRRGMRL
jgi:hypothetical protein